MSSVRGIFILTKSTIPSTFDEVPDGKVLYSVTLIAGYRERIMETLIEEGVDPFIMRCYEILLRRNPETFEVTLPLPREPEGKDICEVLLSREATVSRA